jgi:hypothetical protein
MTTNHHQENVTQVGWVYLILKGKNLSQRYWRYQQLLLVISILYKIHRFEQVDDGNKIHFESWLVVEDNIIFEGIFVTKIKTYKTINSNVSTRKSTCACYCSGPTYGYNISTC